MITRQSIINSMLSVVGESGVSSLMTTHPSVQTASNIVDVEDTDLQSRGWWFNRELDLKLTQETDGTVQMPDNTLSIERSNIELLSNYEKQRYVRRGLFMYDVYRHTKNIGQSVCVNLVVQLDTNDLPIEASSYLLHCCRYKMYVDDDGDTFKTQELKIARAEAWEKLQSAQMKSVATNAMDRPAVRLMNYRLRAGYSTGNPNLIGGRIR